MLVPDGFPGQRYRILSPPVARRALRSPLTSRLTVTDAGYFPHAAHHGRSRPHGAEQAIVIVCVDGAGTVSIEGDELAVGAGHAVAVGRGVAHSYVTDEADPWTIWWMHVDGADADELVGAIVAAAGGALVRIRDVYALVGQLEIVVAALERDETAASMYAAAGAAWHALAMLASSALLPVPPSGDRVGMAQEYLREHLDTHVTVAELARMAGMSASHFSVRFRATVGLSILEYLKGIRSARARELLVTTTLSVAEISLAVGYRDPFYFSRQFRAVNGMSPSAFRAQRREDIL